MPESPTEQFLTLPTGIDSLDKLLVAKAESDTSRTGGIAYHPRSGFFGIIFGAAGSGKSILSLQLCCEFARKPREEQTGKPEVKQKKKPPFARHALYLTPEPIEVIKAKIEEFGFCKNEYVIYQERDLLDKWRKGSKQLQKRSTLAVVQMPLNPERQRSKLDYLFRRIEEVFGDEDVNCQKSQPECHGCPHLCKKRILICLDNAETIDRTAFPEDRESESAKPEMFFKKLRAYCARRRFNTWFTFEEKHAETQLAEEFQIATTNEAYAADIVIRLGIRVFANGYRERSFEIVKAKNQSVRRGHHHFSIRSGRMRAKPHGFEVYPSLATQLHVIGRRDASNVPPEHPEDTKSYCLGISEVDREIDRLNSEVKGENSPDEPKGHLATGTVSVLVSDLDSMASEIALHFSLLNANPGKKKALYISTLHDKQTLDRMVERYTALKDRDNKLEVLALFPEHISEGKLLRDIQKSIEDCKAKRVVFDNVFELSKRFPLIHDEKHFLSAVFAMLRYKNVAALVVDMVEVGEGSNPVSGSFAAGIADHIFALRHVELRSELSRVFSVLKLAGLSAPKKLWELVEKEEKDKIHAEDHLAFFKGVLSGKIEPVDVKLSLFAESDKSPLHKYIKTRERVLQEIFGRKLKIHTCTTETYSALQQSVENHVLYALGDCHVISIDEIWLEELIFPKSDDGKDAPPYLQDICPDELGKETEWGPQVYITAGQDIAVRFHPTHKNAKEGKEPNYAIPDRNNVGVLAFDPSFLDRWPETNRPDDDGVKLAELRAGIVAAVKNVLGSYSEGDDIHDYLRAAADGLRGSPAKLTWKDLIHLQSEFVIQAGVWCGRSMPSSNRGMCFKENPDENGTLRKMPFPGVPPVGIFTCSMETRETCVSFFLELMLSTLDEKSFPVDTDSDSRKLDWKLGPKEGWLTSQGIPETKNAWAGALMMMMQLLSPWDILQLSHAWYRPIKQEPPCLLSRQWFSGWGALGQDRPGLTVLELPKGAAGEPTPVSGAWYLGILKGSTATRAGARIITQLAPPNDELHRFNRGIAMPVRRAFYDDKVPKEGEVTKEGGEPTRPIEARQIMPYRERFQDLGKAMADYSKSQESGEPGEKVSGNSEEMFNESVLRSRCPFYRQVIKDYRDVSPLLMGMIVEAARIVLRLEYHDCLWRFDDAKYDGLMKKYEALVMDCEKRYEA